ncbi:MAG TPA: hypothetical protein VMF65_09980, partial [Acidimicrobiales bacterium]|nr:hypothetical protein [Acidimicrobiales bacterium]
GQFGHGIVVLVEGATHSEQSWAARNNGVTVGLVAIAGLTFLLKAGGGLYWLIPAIVASLVGGVIDAWLSLLKAPG